MNKALCEIQMRHLRAVIAALRLIDLQELAACAQEHGTEADRALIAAVIAALNNLPDDSHH